MNKIEQYLNLASRMYYGGSPIISDEVFDQLADSINYKAVGSKEYGVVEKHWKRMYSLQKHYADQGKPPFENKDASISIKLDGAAISALYIDGQLVRVLTRGDGLEGQVITDKFLSENCNIIPKSIKTTHSILQVTGEIVAPKHIPNARNYAAGALNLKDLEEFRTKAISFYAYGVSPYLTDSYDKDMKALAKLGFYTIKENDLDQVFPSDGIVFRINNNSEFESLGYTAKFPRGAYALKERQEAVETKLLAVEWNTGRTGKVTPVAILEPIMIGDAVVSRATLNNPGFIEMLDLHIGDTVGIVRSGEIIPCIVYKADV